MLRNAVRAGLLSVAAGCILLAAGCNGTCFYSGRRCPTIYDPCCRSCCGLQYEGCCTCRDDLRDRVNQVSDIFLP
ncbi:MAG: hypothetical protein ACM3U2_08645 [Deltaproteobacteria bacterium]